MNTTTKSAAVVLAVGAAAFSAPRFLEGEAFRNTPHSDERTLEFRGDLEELSALARELEGMFQEPGGDAHMRRHECARRAKDPSELEQLRHTLPQMTDDFVIQAEALVRSMHKNDVFTKVLEPGWYKDEVRTQLVEDMTSLGSTAQQLGVIIHGREVSILSTMFPGTPAVHYINKYANDGETLRSIAENLPKKSAELQGKVSAFVAELESP